MKIEKTRVLLIVFVLVAIIGSYGVAAEIGVIEDPIGVFGDNENSQENRTIYDAIPAQSNTVVLLDPVGFTEDPVTKDVGNYLITEELGMNKTYEETINETFEELNQNISKPLDETGAEADIEVREFGKLVAFGNYSESELGADTLQNPSPEQLEPRLNEQYAGAVIELDVSEDELDELFEVAKNQSNSAVENNNATLEKTTYNGHTIYTVAGNENGEYVSVSLGVLSIEEGLHTFGRTDIVKDSIDAYEGEIERVSDDVIPPHDDNTYFSAGSSGLNSTIGGERDGLTNATVNSFLASYSTDGQDEAHLRIEVTFRSLSNAIKYNQDVQDTLSAPSDDLSFTEDINVSLDNETVIISYRAKSNDIEDSINDTISTFRNSPLFGGSELRDDYTYEPPQTDYEPPEAEVDVTITDDRAVSFRVVEPGEYLNMYMRQNGRELKDRSKRITDPIARGEIYSTVTVDEYDENAKVEVVGTKIKGTYPDTERVTEVIRTIDPQDN